ncbi:3-phosphoshikimate 1-carboxyvinyltransferase [Aliikangiella coralliicola]|uniref:3-phosphoshikimate 1-carboxyvinyltransferase n=1 Tax=Aliikangiella coralliicola TaxID=2592383 RepID=UPI00143D4EB8|nr:3-phosphoshikimate 1-carboxyvinyltransferase [Aliikangiella coralliicola]
MNREIIPNQKINASIQLPGSKYVANRLVPMCALATSKSKLTNVVNNKDINTAIEGLSNLGYHFEKTADGVNIFPREQGIQSKASLYTAHSGTFSRFVAAVAALEQHPVSIGCSDKMATRPMVELFDALTELSVKIDSPNQCLPATITGPVIGNECHLDAARSSQYLSALLIIAPLLADGLQVKVDGEVVSRAYVDMTIQLMQKMGVEVVEQDNCFSVKPNQSYQGLNYAIPGDSVSATYFMGAAAISGGKVTIKNFDLDSVQGEAKFYQVLESMGARIEINGADLTIIGPEEPSAIEVDMGGMPDAVQTLAAVACYAKGTTKITNIAHLAFKESNRIEDTAKEIRKTGIEVESGEDFLIIHGGAVGPADINTHEDHRMAMSLALLGIKTAGIRIVAADVVEKSFPDYWEYMTQIGIDSRCF